MSSNNEFTKLPISLGIEVSRILKEKHGIEPRTNTLGILTFEYSQAELGLIEKLNFINPSQGCLAGIELLPNLKSLRISSAGNTAYTQDKNISSISDKDGLAISKCENLEVLEIENQNKLAFLDFSRLQKLNGLTIKGNSRLEEIFGLDTLERLWTLDCYGNERLVQIDQLSKTIMQNSELTDLSLDVLLYPDAVGYDKMTGKLDDETVSRLKDIEVSWHEILSSGKSIKINNYQMKTMHDKAYKALNDYVPRVCSKHTAVVGIEQYLAENVVYDRKSLKSGHSHTVDGIVSGPLYGANGAYNAFVNNTCVCEGYTRAMQYLLKLEGIRSHNVHCIAGEDTLGMSTDKGTDKYKTYNLPDDGYHSIISIDDVDFLYDDPCWNAGLFQRGDTSLPWTLLTKEEISKDHTLSFEEGDINNNHLSVPRYVIEDEKLRLDSYRSSVQNSAEAAAPKQDINVESMPQ